MLSVQSGQAWYFKEFRPAFSDFFLPAMVLGLLLTRSQAHPTDSRDGSLLPVLIVMFAVLFLTLGNTVAFMELRTIPQWTWLNKDIGLLDLLLSFFAILHLADTREKLQSTVKIFVLSGSIINFAALLGGIAWYVFGIPNVMMREESSLRLTGLMVNPNAYGGFVFCVFFLQAALLIGNSGLLPLSRNLQRLNLVFLGMAAMMTLSRSALLGFAAGTMALLFFHRVKAGLRLAAVGCVCLTGLTAVLYWYSDSSRTSAQFWGVELSDRTILERIDINRVAVNMLVGGPPIKVITGIGVGTFLSRSETYLGMPLIIHNDFLWLLVETGLWGFLLFTCILGRGLLNCVAVVRMRVAESPIAVGVACALVGTVGWMLGTEGLWHRHVWFLLALSESYHRLCVRAPATSSLEKLRLQKAWAPVAFARRCF
ncbi:MAG: O-antigen ligase family protein [Candidatus Acidiferrales bacterium]